MTAGPTTVDAERGHGPDVRAGSAPRSAYASQRPAAAVRHLWLVERLAPLRSALTITQFRGILGAFWIGGICLASIGGATLGVALRIAGELFLTPGDPLIIAGLALIVLYAEALCAMRMLSGQRRRQVCASPNAPLLRSFDVPRSAVFTVLIRRPLVRWQVLILIVATTAAVSLGPASTAARWWVPAMAVGTGCALSALTALACLGPAPTRTWGATVLAATTSVALGIAGGLGWRLLAAPARPAIPAASVEATLTAAGLVALALGAVSLPIDRWARSRLADLYYDVPTKGGSTDRSRGRLPTSPDAEAARSRRVFDSSPLAPLAGTGWRSVVVLTLFPAGMAVAGVTPSAEILAWALPLITGYVFVTAIVTAGVSFAVVGPTVMLDRYRWRWENSDARASSIAWSGVRFHLGLQVIPASVVALCQSAIAGRLILTTVALALTLVGAAVAAESLLAPVRQADGTTTTGPVVPVLILLATAPVIALPSGGWGSAFQVIYTLLTIGIGLRCLTRRILRHPSS